MLVKCLPRSTSTWVYLAVSDHVQHLRQRNAYTIVSCSLPVLCYTDTAWGELSVECKSRLQRLQNRAARIIRNTLAKNEEDYGRSRVFDSCPLLMEQSSSANKTGNTNRLFQALCHIYLRYHGRWIDSVWKSRSYVDALKENPINLDIFWKLNSYCQRASRAKTRGWRGRSIIKPCAWVDFGTGRWNLEWKCEVM